MKLGKAYKFAATAAAHRARAMRYLQDGDHENAKKEEVAYLDCVENISSSFRQQMLQFTDQCLQAKLAVSGPSKRN